MSKRKQQNMELERQQKKRNMIFRVISLAVTAVVLFAVGFGFWTVQDSRWVLRYDGGRVSVNDFRALMDIEFQNNEMFREIALGSLEQLVAVRDKAIYHNVDFTAEEREDAINQVSQEIRMERMFQIGFDTLVYIDDERLAELFIIDPLVVRLLDIYVPLDSVVLDEEEFAELLEVYLEEEIDNYLDLQLHMVMLFDQEEIEEAHSLIGTMDFVDIMRQFMPEFAEMEEIEPISAHMVASWFEDHPENQEYILGLQPGEYTHIIELIDQEMEIFFIFYTVSREEPDPVAVTEIFRERNIQMRRNEIFGDYVAEWVEEANFRVNRRGYNAVA